MKPFVPVATFGVHPLTSAQIQAKLRRHAYGCSYCREHPTSNVALIHFVLDSYAHLFPTLAGELHPVAIETLSILASAPSMMSVLRRSQEVRNGKEEE
jgi:hypothetical protein